MNLEEMVYSLAKDVEKLLQRAGELRQDEKHPVVNQLDEWHKEDTESSTPENVTVLPTAGA